MQNKTRTQEISALGHLVIQNSSGPLNDGRFYGKIRAIKGKYTQIRIIKPK